MPDQPPPLELTEKSIEQTFGASGMGNKTVADIAERLQLDAAELHRWLAQKGIKAEKGQTLKAIATQNDMQPLDVVKAAVLDDGADDGHVVGWGIVSTYPEKIGSWGPTWWGRLGHPRTSEGPMGDAPTEILSKLEQARRTLRAGALHESVERSVGQGALELVEEHRRADVIVAVRGGFQEAWSRREELSTMLHEQLAAIAPHSRKEGVPINFREIDHRQPVRTITCTNCCIRPGLGPCPTCSGTGVLIAQVAGSSSTDVLDCPECEDGFATCTVCGGSTQCVEATVRYVNFKSLEINHVVGAEFRDVLRRAYPDATAPPPGLAYDLEGVTQTAYRGQHPTAADDFHGYGFGDAVQQARAFVRRVQTAPNFVIHELRAYALPFVLATFTSSLHSHRAVLYIGVHGTPDCSLI